MFSLLLPQALQLPVLVARNWPARKILRNLVACDLVIGFPLLWQELHRHGHRLPDDVFGVTSTAPCDADSIIALRQAGLARMTEIYGASETAGIGYRHDASRAYRLFSYWERVPIRRRRGSRSGYRPAPASRELEQWIFSQFKVPERPVALTFGSGLGPSRRPGPSGGSTGANVCAVPGPGPRCARGAPVAA